MFFTKVQTVMICERCGMGRKFDSDSADKIHKVASEELGWLIKEDDIEKQIKHFCPNCKKFVKNNGTSDIEKVAKKGNIGIKEESNGDNHPLNVSPEESENPIEEGEDTNE